MADDSIFVLGKTHQAHVSVSREEWDVLQTSGARGGAPADMAAPGGGDFRRGDGRLVHVGGGFRMTFPWVRADLTLNEVRLDGIGLRYKGNNSFMPPNPARPFSANLKAKTDLFGGKADWHGVEMPNFHAGGRDPSLMRQRAHLLAAGRSGRCGTVPGHRQGTGGNRVYGLRVEQADRGGGKGSSRS